MFPIFLQIWDIFSFLVKNDGLFFRNVTIPLIKGITGFQTIVRQKNELGYDSLYNIKLFCKIRAWHIYVKVIDKTVKQCAVQTVE